MEVAACAEHWEREGNGVERQRERPYCEPTKSTWWYGTSTWYSPRFLLYPGVLPAYTWDCEGLDVNLLGVA